MRTCKTCGSTAPHMHPAVQHEGEVEVCADRFHLTETPQNKPEYIAAVRRKRHENCGCVGNQVCDDCEPELMAKYDAQPFHCAHR
jgi:hypothetical protein